MLPIGVRGRQLKVRTLLAGMCLAQADHRPAHLTRVHQALTGLSDDDQRRLGVIADWKHGPHLLTYRQTERTFGLVAAALGKDEPDGLPSQALQAVCDDLLEASVPGEFKDASTSLAVDWTDMESFSRPPPARGGDCADPEASWGHRKNNLLRSEDELFFGYYLSAAIMMPDENGPAVPELARRATVSSCRHDPVRAFVPVLTAMPAAGIPLGDILADSGYAHRDAAAWALPLRDAGASSSRTCTRTTAAPKAPTTAPSSATATCTARARPAPLLELGPLTRSATREQAAAHDAKTAETARYKLGRITATTPTATTACSAPPPWARSAARSGPSSMSLDRDRPEILPPPATSPGLLHPADHHRPARGHRQDGAETRLPLRRAPPLLRPPHRRRTRLRHRQGPRHQRHQPRLVPPHGPGAADAVHHHPAHRPQPAHPAGLERPAGRKRTPRRQRPAPENPPPAPQNAHRARRHQAALAQAHTTRTREQHPAASTPAAPALHAASASMPGNRTHGTQKATRQTHTACDTAATAATPGTGTRMSDPNVKIGPTET